ncbi:YjiH family protein [Ignavigranum ruoffiae]|uniref:Nucleoside recognition GATE domain-containing membrane protein YjiH n=1 Tax=Ignavigranum ruoffiae TaxID=89093 RepID=A0A1H8YWR6_9LACT|nr:YjiH family protein [Ignavigranum ruoffiae]SEP56517.1 nucleoside recognition GATE domain-containing membrane protein YjiH [Ignavigranum ruoffiae]
MNKEDYTNQDVFQFVIPSLVGILLLMTPFTYEGSTTVAVSVLSNWIYQGIDRVVPIPYLILCIITLSFLISIVGSQFKPKFLKEHPLLNEVGHISWFWMVVRAIGMLFAWLTAFKLGPEVIWSESTGGLILNDLIGGLFTIFLVAAFILPFLTEFGLLEFVGVYLTKIMRPLFDLPGRSAVDCVASWVGDGTIGVTLTSSQYEQGYYTEKEASIIATTFSAVSITFCLVVLQNVDLTDYFGFYYLTVVLSGICCALIIPHLPPLSRKSEQRLAHPEDLDGDVIPDGYSRSQWALRLAIRKAKKNGSVWAYFNRAIKTIVNLWLSVIPIIMAVGTMALILSENTEIFTWLGKPFLPLLQLLQVPEAQAASQTVIVGFADMVVPSIMAAEIQNPMTRFIIASLSVVQLIYLSETGAVILGSKLPVNLWEIFVIFIERTLISLPIIVLIANLIF